MISIAPMIDISNHHFRALIRIISKQATLYTEMKSADAVIHNHAKLLPFHQSQHPIILQIGGSDPQKLGEAARIGEIYGYDGINLNVGCPSARVQKGNFGVSLMKQPQLVRNCMDEMSRNVKIPCSVKCRVGVDSFDSFQFLSEFVRIVSDKNSQYPIKSFIIHARKALLNGINPEKNRMIPPLEYEKVFRLKNDFPHLSIEINGGIKTIDEGFRLMTSNGLDGFMVGRLAIQNPFELRNIDTILTKKSQSSDSLGLQKLQIIKKYISYLEQLQRGQLYDKFNNSIETANMFTLIKPIINFYNGEKYACRFRRHLSDLTQLKHRNLTQILLNYALQMAEVNQSSQPSRIPDFQV